MTTAKKRLARGGCRLGRVSFRSSNQVRKGRVLAQKPQFGAVLPGGGRVALVVSRGRK
jgi:beta-lactam-binding protein with PASTA domain